MIREVKESYSLKYGDFFLTLQIYVKTIRWLWRTGKTVDEKEVLKQKRDNLEQKKRDRPREAII